MAFLGFWGFVASYAMRVNLSMAMVDMVSGSTSKALAGEFDWNGEDEGIILGAFFWGYVVTQVPGGMLAEHFGGKWPFGIGMLITAVFSLLTPLAARSGKGVLILVRIIQGLGEVRKINRLIITNCNNKLL